MLANSSSILAGGRIAGDSDFSDLIRTAGSPLRGPQHSADYNERTGCLDWWCDSLYSASPDTRTQPAYLILLYGSSYWNELINFEALVRYGVISPEDLDLFKFADDSDTALTLLKGGVSLEVEGKLTCICYVDHHS